jgi:DNA repair protein RadC
MLANVQDLELIRLILGPHAAERVRGRPLDDLLDSQESELADLGLPVVLRLRLMAVAEVARRHQPAGISSSPLLDAHQALSHFRLLRPLAKEAAAVALLDARLAVMCVELISAGGRAMLSLSPADVLRPAVVHGASALILAHNHPTGDTAPSPEDVEFTRRLVEAGTALGVEVLDHLVVARRSYVSFKRSGLMTGLGPSADANPAA